MDGLTLLSFRVRSCGCRSLQDNNKINKNCMGFIVSRMIGNEQEMTARQLSIFLEVRLSTVPGTLTLTQR